MDVLKVTTEELRAAEAKELQSLARKEFVFNNFSEIMKFIHTK